MDRVAARIFETKTVTDDVGSVYPLHSHTSRDQCEFIQQIIRDIGAKTTLEVGLAYGVSTLFICEAVRREGGNRHYVIDAQQMEWHNVGLKNLRDAGYESMVQFKGVPSHDALPKLLASGTKLDFAYVDTTKLFDVVLVDAYYIFLMLRVGGVLVLDDCNFPGLRKLARYLALHPSLRVYRTFGSAQERRGKRLLSRLCNWMPGKHRLFAPGLLTLDSALGVNAQCVAFQKISEDSREWHWFENF